jgi:ATP-dependent protease ClpP protease subunit
MHKRLLQLLRDNAQREATGLRLEQSADSATLYLYDVIDPYWGIAAADVCKQIADLQGMAINLRINSPGGDVFDGRAIATAIAQHGNVTAWIDGIAASAATTVAIAAKQINIADGAMFMIHNAWTLAYGNKSDLAETITLLEKIDQAIIADYCRKTKQSVEQVTAWMDAETWFSAQEALDSGFVDQLVTGNDSASANNAARWNLSAFANAPKPKQPPQAPDHNPHRDACARRLRLLIPNS